MDPMSSGNAERVPDGLVIHGGGVQHRNSKFNPVGKCVGPGIDPPWDGCHCSRMPARYGSAATARLRSRIAIHDVKEPRTRARARAQEPRRPPPQLLREMTNIMRTSLFEVKAEGWTDRPASRSCVLRDAPFGRSSG